MVSDGTVTHLALRLLILTGVRSGPLRHLHETHIQGNVWTISGEAMKGRKGATSDFRVPLVPEALEIIDQARRHTRGGYLFPSTQRGVISDMTMSSLMKRRGMAERPHGFRSSLRNWIAETLPGTPHEVAEACLGHVTDSKVVRAYRRTDFLEQRRAVMEAWAGWVTQASDKQLRPAKVREIEAEAEQ